MLKVDLKTFKGGFHVFLKVETKISVDVHVFNPFANLKVLQHVLSATFKKHENIKCRASYIWQADSLADL